MELHVSHLCLPECLEVAFLTNPFLLSNVAPLFKLQILHEESTIVSVALLFICFIIIMILHEDKSVK